MTKSKKMTFGWFDYAAFITFFAYAAGSVVLPVTLVQLSRDIGFSLEEGGLTAGGALHFARTIAMMTTMLLSGFFAASFGLRKTLGYSVFMMAIGMLACIWSPNYGLLLMAIMIAGTGEGVVEALATPFVQRLHISESGRYINFTHSFWSVGVLTTVIMAAVLLWQGVSWRIITAMVAFTGLVPAFMLLCPAKRILIYPDHTEKIAWKIIHSHFVEIIRSPRFWLFFTAMFLAGGGEFCLTFWSASYVQLNFNAPAWAGGIATAFFAGGMVLGRTGWGYLIKQHQLNKLIGFSALAGAAICITFPILTNLWLFFALLMFAGIATAPLWPSIQSHCTDRLDKLDTTMLFILLSCAGIPGCGFFTLLMGYIGNKTGSLANAFYLIPICFGLIAILMLCDRLIRQKPAVKTTPDKK